MRWRLSAVRPRREHGERKQERQRWQNEREKERKEEKAQLKSRDAMAGASPSSRATLDPYATRHSEAYGLSPAAAAPVSSSDAGLWRPASTTQTHSVVVSIAESSSSSSSSRMEEEEEEEERNNESKRGRVCSRAQP